MLSPDYPTAICYIIGSRHTGIADTSLYIYLDLRMCRYVEASYLVAFSVLTY